jgi:hypothetical protein
VLEAKQWLQAQEKSRMSKHEGMHKLVDKQQQQQLGMSAVSTVLCLMD